MSAPRTFKGWALYAGGYAVGAFNVAALAVAALGALVGVVYVAPFLIIVSVPCLAVLAGVDLARRRDAAKDKFSQVCAALERARRLSPTL